jgi:hypothetical protein
VLHSYLSPSTHRRVQPVGKGKQTWGRCATARRTAPRRTVLNAFVKSMHAITVLGCAARAVRRACATHSVPPGMPAPTWRECRPGPAVALVGRAQRPVLRTHTSRMAIERRPPPGLWVAMRRHSRSCTKWGSIPLASSGIHMQIFPIHYLIPFDQCYVELMTSSSHRGGGR